MTHPNDHKFLYCPRWLAIRLRDILAAIHDPATDYFHVYSATRLAYLTDTGLANAFEQQLLALAGPPDSVSSPIVELAPRQYARVDAIRETGITPQGDTYITFSGPPGAPLTLIVATPLITVLDKLNAKAGP